MKFLNLPKLLLLCALSFAGTSYAQTGELSITDGGIINTSAIGKGASFEGVAFDHQFTAKLGILFPTKIGVGLFYEQAYFSKKETYAQQNGPTLNGTIAIAEPQRTIGLEVYTKAALSNTSYLRFGALFGYASARTPNPVQSSGFMHSQDFSYSTGFDISYGFTLTRRLSGVLNTGLRYSQANYGAANSGAVINTYSFPLTAGVNYSFGGSTRKPVKKGLFGGGRR